MAYTNKALLIQVNNSAQLAQSQGAAASFVQSLAPATIESKIYSTLQDKLGEALKDQGVDATVTVVEPKAFVSSGVNHIGADLGYGLGIFGVLGIVWYFYEKGKR